MTRRTAILTACIGLAVVGVVLVGLALAGFGRSEAESPQAGAKQTPGPSAGPRAKENAADPLPSQLNRPIELRQVVDARPGRCRDERGVPAAEGSQCYMLSGGFTIEQVDRIDLRLPKAQTQWAISIDLADADGQRFAVLTQKIANLAAPQNQIAIVVDDEVISAPAVLSPITGGMVEISQGGGRDAAEKLLRKIVG